MKKTRVNLVVIIISILLSSGIIYAESGKSSSPIGNKLENGWYNATVKYENYNTSTFSTYTLEIKIENDRVIKINFGNGGSIHTGYNTSGYIYTGGYLSFEKDYSTNQIKAATSTVTITSNGSMKYYKVRIE